MSTKIMFLGGANEIGANSCYLYLDGTGIIIDAGLHPRKRNKDSFPHFESINDDPTDVLLLTHAHTDHIGSIPYLLKFHPHLRFISTLATRDLSEIMLADTAKILKSEIYAEFSTDSLSYYKKETLVQIHKIIEGYRYKKKLELLGRAGRTPVKIHFHHSGHILGSAAIYLENNGKSILHTGDIQFRNQAVMAKAELPMHHVDCLIVESTNASSLNLPEFKEERKRLARFINKIIDSNGSVLIPSFALGKTQEILKILSNLMFKGSIPHLPIYTSGMGNRISKIYDKYCYTVPFTSPGFEVSDIPQLPVIRKELLSAGYFKESSLVVVPAGMMNKGTTSYSLAKKWMTISNFGISFIGWQDPESPGFSLLNSEKDKEFDFAGEKVKRKCEIERFRFTSHAYLDDMIEFILNIKPKILFIIHGEPQSADNLALKINELLPQTRILIPTVDKYYDI